MTEGNWQLAKKQHNLIQRARIMQQVRAFFIAADFLEVETPQRIPVNAPELYIDAVASADWYLQTSPELCMKRLLAAGFQQIFQICHCWRAGERGQKHLPEYSMLEWYRRDSDYQSLMADCEALFCQLLPQQQLHYQGKQIDLTPPWPRLTLTEAFARYSPLPLAQALAEDQFETILCQQIEPSLASERPLFLIDYPLEQASLARRKADGSPFAERVELYIAGLELANGFSELTDPAEQRKRFEQEERQRQQLGKTACPLPQPFLDELGSLPSAAGIALGIDRLVMLLCDCNDISDIVSFTPECL